MKKTVASVVIAALMLAGCGHPLDVTQPDGSTKTYPTYGFINQNSQKSEKMCYEASFGNIVWSVFTIETVILPVYFIGWSIFNPIGEKVNGKCPGIDG
jgi:hypothetical protein